MITPNRNHKLNLTIFALLMMLSVTTRNANSNIINITVGDSYFSPVNVMAVVGDKIKWTLSGSAVNSVICDGIYPGTSLPEGAPAFNATLSSLSPVFEYTVIIPGIYKYTSTYNSSEMYGKISAESTLPVELTDFVATTIKNEVILDWSTGGETNNDRFEIQRVEINKMTESNLSPEYVTIGVMNGNGTISHIHDYRYIDRNLKSGTYRYRLRQIDYNSNYIYHLLHEEIIVGIPSKFSMSQNYPNPFNPVTKISYELPYDGVVKITLIDAAGRIVSTLVNGNIRAGYQTVEVNGSELSSGIYYYRIEYRNENNIQALTRKMMLVK